MALTAEQLEQIDDERGRILRWLRHYWMGTPLDGQAHERGTQDALRYRFLRDRSSGVYMPESWMMMHGQSALHGDGSHLIKPSVKANTDFVLSLSPHDFQAGLIDRGNTGAWTTAFGQMVMFRTVRTGTKKLSPERFNPAAGVPSHTATTGTAVIERVMGYSQ